MSHPIKQYQHRVPQVYLKQFGFENDGEWYVSVLENGKDQTERKKVDRFTAEINVFDITIIPEIELKRHFEITCQKIEAHYRKVINTIDNQNQLIRQHRSILAYFVASLICRSSTFRDFYKILVKDIRTREKFISEITMFQPELAENFDVVFWYQQGLEEQFQSIITFVASHFTNVFHGFNFVILKSPKVDGRIWLTSDNPVIFDRQGNYNYILPLETEIYLPLSREYCLFMYHESSSKTLNPLRKLATKGVHLANFATHGYISMKIAQNSFKYLILPGQFDHSFQAVNNSQIIRIVKPFWKW